MKTQVTFNQIVENLVKVFASESESAVYNSKNEQRVMYCGWTGGTMSPESRPAYVADFGAETVARAEQEARARLAANETQYKESAHAAHIIEAQENEANGNKAPEAGAFVFGIHSGFKCDGGRGLYEEIHNVTAHPDTIEDKAANLCRVSRLIVVTAANFARPELADELVNERQKSADGFPGGAGICEEDKERRDIFNKYRYYYTDCAAVVCRDSGRWYLIDSEGYSYARYILLPTSWREMYAAEVSEEEQREQERRDAEARREAQEKAERLAAYTTRCNKWAKLLQDVRPLQEAENNAIEAHGWRSAETKAAARTLAAARRKNIQTMAAHHFPALKVSVKKSDRWATAYDVTYTDGPTLETFKKFTDFDLFVQCVETFNGWDDSTDYTHEEFTDFAKKFAGFAYGGVHVEREQSSESRAELLALVQDVAGITDDERHDWNRATLDEIAKRAGINGGDLENAIMYEGRVCAAFVARCVFNLKNYTQPDTNPDKPKGSKQTAAAQTDEAPAEGLQLIDTADGVAVIGNDWRDTYFNKKQIKAHGATWNKERKQWEATAAEDCETLRRWFALRKEEQTAAPLTEESTEAEAARVIEAAEIEEPHEITKPIKADDLHTPRVLQYSERRYIVKGCTPEQVEELEQRGGKRTADGVIFAASKATRDALHIWQNEQSKKERAEILGEGWQYAGNLHETPQAKEGDIICSIDGTTGICTQSHPESCVIKFKSDKDGKLYSICGYFFRPANYSESEKSEPASAANYDKGTAKYYAEQLADNANEEKPLFFRFGSREIVLKYNGNFWDLSNANGTGTQYDITTDEAADVLAELYKESGDAPTTLQAWRTCFTADDFQKLATQSEINEDDRDIIGKRFRFVSKYGNMFELQIFVQDYAGNEAHALYYIWDEFLQEVRANVRSLSWLRDKLTEANGWQAA